MVVADYMTRNVSSINDESRLLDAALMIRRTGKRHLPIVSAKTGKVVGIISDRDVQRYSPSVLEPHTEEEYNQVFEATPITKVMTRKPIMVRADAPLAEAVQLLYTKRIGALLVGKNGELEGILSVTDLLGVLLEQLTGSHTTKSASGIS